MWCNFKLIRRISHHIPDVLDGSISEGMLLVVAPEVTEYVSYRDNGFKATDGSAMLLNVRLDIRVIIALILDDHVA